MGLGEWQDVVVIVAVYEVSEVVVLVVVVIQADGAVAKRAAVEEGCCDETMGEEIREHSYRRRSC